MPGNCHLDNFLKGATVINNQKMVRGCVVTGHGNLTVLLIGNSYAEKISRGVLKALGNKIKSLYIVYKPYCSVISGLSESGSGCETFESIVMNVTEQLQPDILFISSKFHAFPIMTEPISKDPENPDNATRFIQEGLEEFSNFTDHIVILEPQAKFNQGIAYHLAKSLAGYEDIRDLYYTMDFVHESQEPLLARLNLIDCPKCIRVNLQDEFCSNKTGLCDTFDPVSKLAYFGDNHHFTKYGVAKVFHRIKEAVDRIFNTIVDDTVDILVHADTDRTID